MPHAIIEYSSNISEIVYARHMLSVVHGVMQTCGLFDMQAIKTRSCVCHDYLVGNDGVHGSFVHVTIYLMEGRTVLQKQKLTDMMFQALYERMMEVTSITVDIRELDKETYRKK